MAQLGPDECLLRAIRGEADVDACILGLIDRLTGRVGADEGQYADFKQHMGQGESAYAELARDILAFSNSKGGLLLFGVTDYGIVVGHQPLNAKDLRERVAPYAGTRVDFETALVDPVVNGVQKQLPVVLVRRSIGAYPKLLRRHIELTGNFGRKIKYSAGSLFYRDGKHTLVEPAGGDIESRAIELGFTGASPRTRTSFLIKEDRPGVRLYSHINERFVGRDHEIADLSARFDDSKGRGVSIAGQGGIGKTELAIEIANRLHVSGKFKYVYSGSAKRSLLGPAGAQSIEPLFYDLPTFLRDVSAWLGLDAPIARPAQELESACVKELAARNRTLLFIDNLETIADGRLFEFLERKLPLSVSLLTTSRVHKVKNYIYAVELGELDPRDAAHLLRYELKRFGLQELASRDIKALQDQATKLHLHPLAIRWYAWRCYKNPAIWERGPEGVPKTDLESFCVGHTLENLTEPTLKVLAAIAAVEGQTDVTPQVAKVVAGVDDSHLDMGLYELECAGLVSVSVDDQTGRQLYSIAPLALQPARDIARNRHWERMFTNNLQSLLDERPVEAPIDPLLSYLLQLDPRQFRDLGQEQLEDIKRRIERASKRQHRFELEMLYLQAECERHLKNIITADELYEKAAELVIKANEYTVNQKHQAILVEAATVARIRSHARPQIERAARYLDLIKGSQYAPLRVLGSLVELFALMGNRKEYDEHLRQVRTLRDAEMWRFSQSQLYNLEEALARAAEELALAAPKASA